MRRISETRFSQGARRSYYSGESSIGYDLSNGVSNSSRAESVRRIAETRTSREARRSYYSGETSMGYELPNGV